MQGNEKLEIPNAETLKAIEEVKSWKLDLNKKAYPSFEDYLKKIEKD